MKKSIWAVVLILALATVVEARELYKVSITSNGEAERLTSLEVEPVICLHDGYLILADITVAEIIESQFISEHLSSDIEKDQLAIDRRYDRANVGKYPLVFEQDNFRLFKVEWSAKIPLDLAGQIMPINNKNLRIEYHRPRIFNTKAGFAKIDLDSLIGLVDQDSVEAYLYRLEDFQTRLTGTDSCNAARDWIAGKFASFGYDSVVIDPFIGSQLWDRVPVQSYNVIATKVGSRFPDRQIIVGAHFDAVPDCPGVDDNGTGTAGVLEIARILKDIETEMTFVFIAFDSEESWMWGSYHYADSVYAEGANIIYMQNLDMIGHHTNHDEAYLYYGPEVAYSVLWRDLADSLVGITGHLWGSTASDHLPFQQNGYDVTFVQEYFFSTHYHQPSDSTTYINFDYMTRMIKASLATVYTINYALIPVTVISVLDVGDGQSLQITWEPDDPTQVDHYLLYYGTDPEIPTDSVYIPNDSSRYILSGLAEGMEYYMRIIPFDIAGNSAIAYDRFTGIPYSKPALPQNLAARPLVEGIRVSWYGENRELDFDHYQVIRDGALLPDFVYDSVFDDWGPNLGSELHEYLVAAVDSDGNISDTTGAVPVTSRAATLQEGRILAVNRSGSNSAAMVDELVTGEFMRQALEGYNFDYYSDTSGSNPNRTGLMQMIDYALIVMGCEGGRQDDIGAPPAVGGILDDIAYYLSLGGKAIVFGRGGDITTSEGEFDTVFYGLASHYRPYNEYFHMQARVQPLTFLNAGDISLYSDFIGAHSLYPEYPDLVRDSAATHNHTGSAYAGIYGIPCASYASLRSGPYDIIYTYNSSNDSILTEGQPVAWRYRGGEYEYVYFDIPLSFIDRKTALVALRQAVSDLGLILDADDMAGEPLPRKFELSQNFPNPFNPTTSIEFYNYLSRPAHVKLRIFNILGQHVKTLFDGQATPGQHRIEWDGTDDKGNTLATGVYFYQLKTIRASHTRRMVLLK